MPNVLVRRFYMGCQVGRFIVVRGNRLVLSVRNASDVLSGSSMAQMPTSATPNMGGPETPTPSGKTFIIVVRHERVAYFTS